ASEPETFITQYRRPAQGTITRSFRIPPCRENGSLSRNVCSGCTTNASPYALAPDLLPGSGPAVRRVLPAGTRADRARRGAGLGLFMVHRAPLPALRRSHAQP